MTVAEERNKRVSWMMNDRFGLFIHWGLYSIPAVGEWKQSYERISAEAYAERYFPVFNPVDFNPAEWARMAKAAGMKYAVLTAKHHEGFCLFDSQYTDFKSTNSPCRKDLVKEFVEAFRNAGLRVGLYYSLFDWHHPEYPHFGDLYHPMRDNEEYRNHTSNFSVYLEYLHAQVRELMTNYGKIDVLWFDNSYGKMVGEVWKATKLVQMVRQLQPEIIINNRLEVNASSRGSLGSRNPSEFSGDYVAPEQIIPPEGILDDDGNLLPWEANCTMNNNWGYVSSPHEYKTAKCLIRKLVECVSKGGNLLVNVGPDARGRIPEPSRKTLKDISRWMDLFGKGVFGCSLCHLPKPEWGYYTQKDNKIYAHIFEQCIGPIPLHIPKEKIRIIRNLYDMSEVHIVQPWNTLLFPEYTFINFGNPPQATFTLPDSIDTVLEIELKQ